MARPRIKRTSKYHLPPGWVGGFFRALYEKGEIEVPGLGTFTVVEIAERKTFHNFSRKVRIIPAYRRLKFSQSPSLKDRLTHAED